MPKLAAWYLRDVARCIILLTCFQSTASMVSLSQEKEKSRFEITAHRIKLHIFPLSNGIEVIDTLSIHLTANDVEHIRIGMLPVYKIDYLTINGKKSDFKTERDVIQLEHIPSDSLFQVVIRYSGHLAFHSEFSLLSKDQAVLREEEILPHGPHALGFVRSTIIVPKEWKAISVGRLVAHDTTADSSTYVWEFDQPIPNIGWICAGKFWSEERTDGNPPIAVHLFEDDSNSAAGILSLTKDVVGFYSAKFTQYRFPWLSIVEVEDWVAGRNVLAIAVPGFIMVKKLAFTTEDRFNKALSVLPHEIAHQWWPATVFVEDQDAAFLSEGMCEYSALLYNESRGTATLRDSLSHHPFLRSLIMRIQQGKDVPLQQKADLRALPTHYLKASYVHNMLRHLVGDSTFFQLYHEYAHRFGKTTAHLSDFEHLAEELSGKKLGWFFDQWVKNRGIPRLKIYNVKSVL
ncbi:MAG: hypothetical protein HY277_08870, partial [Ignavibacteriales bacterium]|nr:hypothetical protein [Ignavibacteriales bacterium]